MDIFTVGGTSAQVKQLYAQMEANSAVKEKSERKDSGKKKDSFIYGEKPKWLEDMERLEKKRSDARVNLIIGKLDKGKDLSPAELSYLGKKRPELYAEAAAVQRKKKYIERKLKQCRSKQEVYNVGLTAAALGITAGTARCASMSACSAAGAVSSAGMAGSAGMAAGAVSSAGAVPSAASARSMSAEAVVYGPKPYWASTGINNTYTGFFGTAQYAKLPQTYKKKQLNSKA